jgi:hypothetical protein
MKPEEPTPKDRAEAIAVFRAEIVGALTKTELARGEPAAELTSLSQKRIPPSIPAPVTTGAITLPAGAADPAASRPGRREQRFAVDASRPPSGRATGQPTGAERPQEPGSGCLPKAHREAGSGT